ncbi:hypothetical protein DPEC_G00377020 [Dallia pectoralis]|nr:hypothetical protein DPEC_G00377020 [Dallia pectoralis]
MQSNTTKTKLLSRLRFVSDKKRLCSQHGYKNTRIEFSSNPSRSANYTSNAKHLLQPYFWGLFETIALSQEPVWCRLNPSRVRTWQELQRLGKVAKLVEMHVHLNRLCCELAQERRGMLTSQEKICLDKVLANYHLKNPEFIHLIPWLLDNPSTLHNNLIVAHLAYLKEEGKVNAERSCSPLLTITSIKPQLSRPHGVPVWRTVISKTSDTVSRRLPAISKSAAG